MTEPLVVVEAVGLAVVEPDPLLVVEAVGHGVNEVELQADCEALTESERLCSDVIEPALV